MKGNKTNWKSPKLIYELRSPKYNGIRLLALAQDAISFAFLLKLDERFCTSVRRPCTYIWRSFAYTIWRIPSSRSRTISHINKEKRKRPSPMVCPDARGRKMSTEHVNLYPLRTTWRIRCNPSEGSVSEPWRSIPRSLVWHTLSHVTHLAEDKRDNSSNEYPVPSLCVCHPSVWSLQSTCCTLKLDWLLSIECLVFT